MTQPVRVIAVVDWHRQRVYGLTCDNAEAQRWTREIVAKYGGDPLAATMTVGLVDQLQPAIHAAAEEPA